MTTLTTNSDVLPIFKTAYGPKLKIALSFTGPGRTKQSFKAECDINNILARFKKTGTLDFVNKHEPQYGDVTGLDFQAAQLVVAEATSMFAAMPAHLRDHFENRPGNFLAFVNDPTNRAKAEELGLLKPKTDASPADDSTTMPAPVPAPTNAPT